MKRNRSRQNQSVALAACTFEINADSGEIHLTPTGRFRARDGRPQEVPAGWYIDAQVAERVIARAAAQANRFVVDYEHQTLYAEANGQPAPAAGWWSGANMVWREGQGLFATGVEWTDRARAAIAAKEYLYLSPVFAYDPISGEVLAVLMAAITNYPAIDGMAQLTARAAAKFQTSQKEEDTVDRTKLIALLGLAETATDAEIDAALAALKTKADKTGNLEAEVVALKAKTETPDPAKFVSIDSHKKLADDFAALKGDIESRDLSDVITTAIDEGRLAAAEETWARDFARQHGLAALKGSLEKRPVIAALKRTQTRGQAPAGGGSSGELDDTALAVCKQLGVSVEDFKKTAIEAAA